MRIALCDDVYHEIEDIEKYLVAHGEEVDFFQKGEALIEVYKKTTPTLRCRFYRSRNEK